MPEPVPTPTPEEIESVVDITMLSTAAVTAMVANYAQTIADAKWAATITDLGFWPDIRDEAGDIKKVGSIEFFENAGIKTRLAFRNRVRSRYGQALLLNESGFTAAATSGYAVTVGADW